MALTQASRFYESGFDPDHGFWWGRDVTGREFRFYVEVSGGDEEES